MAGAGVSLPSTNFTHPPQRLELQPRALQDDVDDNVRNVIANTRECVLLGDFLQDPLPPPPFTAQHALDLQLRLRPPAAPTPPFPLPTTA